MDLDIANQIILLVIKVAGTLVVVPVARALWRWYVQAMQERAMQLLSAWVHESVMAAEQLGFTGVLDEWAMSKLEYATERVEKFLRTQGLDVDLDADEIRALIEAEVRRVSQEMQGDTQTLRHWQVD